MSWVISWDGFNEFAVIFVARLQVYNEQIRDLLANVGPLAVRDDGTKGVVVQGLTLHQVSSNMYRTHCFIIGLIHCKYCCCYNINLSQALSVTIAIYNVIFKLENYLSRQERQAPMSKNASHVFRQERRWYSGSKCSLAMVFLLINKGCVNFLNWNLTFVLASIMQVVCKMLCWLFSQVTEKLIKSANKVISKSTIQLLF